MSEIISENCIRCHQSTRDGDDRRWTLYRDDKITGYTHDGCHQQGQLDEYLSSGLLTSSLTLAATIKHHTKGASTASWERVYDATQRLHERIKEFERAAWFGGAAPEMREQAYSGPRWTFPRVEHSVQALAKPVRGLVGAHDGIDMLVYTTAGRAMVTLRRSDGAEVTVITAEDEQTDRMGMQGIHATEHEVATLLAAGCQWQRFNLKPDSKVGMGF